VGFGNILGWPYLGGGVQTWPVGLLSDVEEDHRTSDCLMLLRIWIALVQAVCPRWRRLTATAVDHCRPASIVRERGLVSVLPKVVLKERVASQRYHRMQRRRGQAV